MIQRLALVVEDDADVREVVAATLSAAGFRVVVAADGLAGFETLARAERPDVVIVDLMMPRMGGMQLIDQMRQFAALRDLPVVGLSALSLEKHQLMAFDAFVAKPFECATLLKAVARGLTLRRPDPSSNPRSLR